MNLKSIATVLLTTGITGAVTLGTTLAPAQAALLKFNFTTSGSGVFGPPLLDGSGSFFLDTSVADQNLASDEGFFENAIKDLTFTRGGTANFSRPESNLLTIKNGETTTLHLGSIGNNWGDFLIFEDPDGVLLNQLSSNPQEYQNRYRTGRYQSQDVGGLTVTDATAIPTPGMALGLLGTGFLALKRKMKQKEHSSVEA